MQSFKQGRIKYYFKVFGMTRPEIETRPPKPSANTLPTRPMSRYVCKVKLVNVVEGDQKAPSSIATTPRCREGATPFPGLLHFTIDTDLILLSVKQGGIKYHSKSLWYDATWRCPLCNGYRRRKWTRRRKFIYLTRLIAFHIALIPLGKVWIQLFSLQLWVNSRANWVLQPW